MKSGNKWAVVKHLNQDILIEEIVDIGTEGVEFQSVIVPYSSLLFVADTEEQCEDWLNDYTIDPIFDMHS